MKLYLDDRREPPDGWTSVRTVEEAQAALRTGRVTHLSLDYDLADGDSRPLVEWMRTEGRWPTYRPRVHSGNPDGGQALKALLTEHAKHLEPPPLEPRGGKKPPTRLSTGGSSRYSAAAKKNRLY